MQSQQTEFCYSGAECGAQSEVSLNGKHSEMDPPTDFVYTGARCRTQRVNSCLHTKSHADSTQTPSEQYQTVIGESPNSRQRVRKCHERVSSERLKQRQKSRRKEHYSKVREGSPDLFVDYLPNQ